MNKSATSMRPGKRIASWGLLLLAFFTVDGLLNFGYFYFEDLARQSGASWLAVFVEELTGGYATLVLSVPTFLFISRFRLTRHRLAVHLPMLTLGLVFFSLAKTSLLWASRAVLFPVAGLGAYDYGLMPYRYPMEFFEDVGGYLLFVAGVHAWLFYRDAKEQEVELERARLDSLRAQIRPHFLFNTLNTISAEMYRDPKIADRMLTRLADLLRHSLAESGSAIITVDEEVRLLKLYAEILEARFSDRLSIDFEVRDVARSALVPSFLLQPLLENAVQHGIAVRPEGGRVWVRAEKHDGRLVLEVDNDGPGLDRPPTEIVSSGVGLSNTVARLEHLYGDQQRLRLSDRVEGGVRVRVEIPFEKAPQA